MLFDRFVDCPFLYTVLDMPQQNCLVCLTNDAVLSVLCFVNSDCMLFKMQHRAWAVWWLSITHTHTLLNSCNKRGQPA